MKHLTEGIYEIIKDYRSDEPKAPPITPQTIAQWVNQFEKNDREFLLKELKPILENHYYSKEETYEFIKQLVVFLSKKFEYSNPVKFLDNARFLNLQAEGKSQATFLGMLGEILKQEYNYEFGNVGNKSKKHCVYLDDVLCTGTTFYYNISKWLEEKENGQTQLDKLQSNKIDLSVVYLFISTIDYGKKIKRINYKIRNNLENMMEALAIHWSADEKLKPTNYSQSDLVTNYEARVIEQSNEHAKDKYSYDSDFYRAEQEDEKFFTSKENRIRLEDILLKKGIEILSNANVSKTNIRPLGFSLPSHKDFGFGALFFTWRNVPNNTPLVFWYSGGGFLPLFSKK